MLKSLQDKLAYLAGSFYDWGFSWTERLSNVFRGAQLSSWLTRRLSKRPAMLCLELFVALSLVVNFYFLAKPTCVPHPNGDQQACFYFSYLSKYYPNTAGDQVQLNWRKRLAGPIVSAWLLDITLKEQAGYGSNEFQIIYGFYNATWLFLLFLILILNRKDALLIMLGVFSGLMYYLTDPSGPSYFPWDMPTVFFFTLACLLYDRRRLWALMVVVWLGGLFKETSLCCALLILLGDHWTLKKRVAGFATTVIVTFAANKCLMTLYGVKAPILAMNDAPHVIDIIRNTRLFSNFDILFSLDMRHVLFANAGSLLIILLIPWRNRRDIVFKAMIVAFIIGQCFCGIINEFRIWYELLPLGWMLISETISNRCEMVQKSQVEPSSLQPGLVVDDQSRRIMKGSYWLTMGVLLVIAVGVLIKMELTPSEREERNKSNPSALRIDPEFVKTQIQIAYNLSQQGDFAGAIAGYHLALKANPNQPDLLNNTAWLLATCPDASLRNGPVAVQFAEKACQLTDYRSTGLVGTLAAAYAEAGRFDDAILMAQKACALASESGEQDLLKKNQELLALYLKHQPYHETASPDQTK